MASYIFKFEILSYKLTFENKFKVYYNRGIMVIWVENGEGHFGLHKEGCVNFDVSNIKKESRVRSHSESEVLEYDFAVTWKVGKV